MEISLENLHVHLGAGLMDSCLGGHLGSVYTWCPGMVPEYSTSWANVNTPFFQVLMLEFGHGASAARLQGQDLILML